MAIGPPPPPDGGNRRRGWFVGGGLLVILVLAMAAYALLGGSPRSGAGPGPKPTQPPVPSATPPASSAPSATASLTLEQEREQVRQAFFDYEDAYALAGKTLDPQPLSAVAQGEILNYSQSAIQHARAINQPYLVRADHNITSIVVAPGLGGPGLGAQVDDSYVDHTVRLNPSTMQPIEPDPNRPGKQSLTFQEVSPGAWKAVFASGIN